MAELVVQKATADAPVVLNFVPATLAGDQFTNTNREKLHVRNDGAAAMTVTIVAQKPCNHGFLHDSAQVVPAGETVTFGAFDTFRFNDAANKVQVGYSVAANVSVAVEG